MQNILELLNFRFNSGAFVHIAENLFTIDTQNKIDSCLGLLNKYSKSDPIKIEPKKEDISATYRKFFEQAKKGREALDREFNTIRSVRMLVYALTFEEKPNPQIIFSQFLPLAVELIDQRWRLSMFTVIVNCLLKNWSHLNNPNGNLLRKIVDKRIANYTGKNQVIRNIKENADYFIKEIGAAKLGGETAASEGNLIGIRAHFNFPEFMDKFEYFGEVAVAYTHTIIKLPNYTNYIEGIIEFLRRHDHKPISKQCLSKLIIKLDNSHNLDSQDYVESEAMHLIGDPAIEAYWSPWVGASRNDEQELDKARTMLNEWITKKFIGLFFEKLAMDSDRKEFWMRYAKKISKFKIFSHTIDAYNLKQDKRLVPYLKTRLGELRGPAVSALVLEVGDYILIEFSTLGHAFYAYKKNNPLCPSLGTYSVSLDDLKNPQRMDPLMNYKGNTVFNLKTEGKFSHKGEWQDRLSFWLRRYLGL